MVFSGSDCDFTPGSPGQIFNIPSLDPLASSWLVSDHFRLLVCFGKESQHGAAQSEHYGDE